MRHWQRLGKRHGRAWWHVGDAFKLRQAVFHVEWCLFNLHTWPAIKFEVFRTWGDDEDLHLRISVPLLGSLWLGVSGVFPPSWYAQSVTGCRTGIALFHEYLWIELWYRDPAEHWGDDLNRFRWQRVSWDWVATFFGRMKCEHTIISDWEPVSVPLPEGTYTGQYRVEERTWSRPRWPIKKVRRAGEIRMDKGAPFPGKGENSWDMGEDAITGMGTPPSKPEAIAAYIEATLEKRERYGGSVAWLPKREENYGRAAQKEEPGMAPCSQDMPEVREE